MTRRARLGIGLLIVLVLLGAGAGLLFGLLDSARGAAQLSRLISSLEPRLRIAHHDGALAHSSFSRIEWREGELAVVLQDVRWDIDSDCLVRQRRLCFDALTIGTLEIHLEDSDGSAEEFSLAAVRLPLGIDLAQGHLGALLVLSGGQQLLRLEDIELRATMRASRIEVQQLQARLAQLRASVTGSIELRAQLPIAATGSAQWNELLDAQLSVEGDLGRLAFTAHNRGDYPLDASGWIAPLASPFAVSIKASNHAPLALATDGDGQFELDGAELQLDGNLQRLEATLGAVLQSPTLGRNTVQAQGFWSEDTLHIEQFAARGDAGGLQATATLDTNRPMGFDSSITLEQFCPPGWAESLDCSIAGTLQIGGSLLAPEQDLRIDAQLAGSVNEYPATLAAQIEASTAGSWKIAQLRLQSAGNTLGLVGEYGPQLALDADIAIVDLGRTLKGAGGSGSGTLRIAGSAQSPTLQGSLRLQQLAWEQLRAASLELEARVPDLAQSGNQLLLRLRDARSGDLQLDTLDARVEGAQDAHQVALDFSGPDGKFSAACNGALARNFDWQGQCSQLELRPSVLEQVWRLSKRFSLGWSHTAATAAIGPFCLDNTKAAICSTQRIEVTAQRFSGVALRARSIPLSMFEPWLPATLAASGEFDLQLNAAREAGQSPQIDATLESGSLQFRPQGEAVALELSAVTATVRADSEQAQLDWHLRVGETGQCAGAVALLQPGAQNRLEGRIELETIDLTPALRSIAGVSQAAGLLGGTVHVAGTLKDPRLSGSLAVASGRLEHKQLPAPIDEYVLAVEFSGAQAQLSGQLRTVAGTADLQGSGDWSGEDWQAQLHLRSTQLQIEPLPGSTLTLVPDIHLSLGPGHTAISGEVQIPEADIRIKALPETASSASSDAVLVGEKPAAPQARYALDLALRLGDRVQFHGLGAEARLSGAIDLRKKPDGALRSRGEIRILEGRYTAYGQDLKVTEGSLLFRDALNRPQLRITAEREIEDESVRVGVRVRGDVRSPEVQVFSIPPMAENAALYYLLTGRAPEQDTNLDLAVASAMIKLGISGANKVTGGAMKQLGISGFEIDARQLEGGTEVRLSGYLTPDLQFRYGVSTFEDVNTLRLRYRLTRKIFIEVISGIESAVDLLYSFER